MKRAIKTHASDFASILALLVLAIVVAGYILNHERLRFPFVQSSPFAVNAEFSTAQAVTPGQGQSIRVSGVQIGQIGNVTLQNGTAIVRMDIDQKYKHLIHTDATALLRPKTGLKDMFVELDPGKGPSPVVKPGYTIPIGNTLPDINVDEILSSLDADTRSYLDLLVNGAGQGLKGKGGSELAQVLERFEPTNRDLARVNTAGTIDGHPKLVTFYQPELERAAHPPLKDAIAHCETVGDYVSRELLEDILKSEEEHIDWLETQIALVGGMGAQNWMQSQAG